MRLEVEGLSKRLGERFALEGLSFEVDSGRCLGLAGASGSGKTTTLRLIAGLDVPDAGEVRVAGVVVCSRKLWIPPGRRGVAMVFQGLALWPHMTVEKNVLNGLDGSVPSADRRRRVVEILERFHLREHARFYPHELSGGERQRVAIARALIRQPGILLLDEPLAHLDQQLRRETLRLLGEMKCIGGPAMILVSHDLEGLDELSDHVVRLEHGRQVP